MTSQIKQLSIVKRSPFEFNDLELCLNYTPDAPIVLLQDAVAAACGEHKWSVLLKDKQVYVIDVDLAARGLSLSTGTTITYQQWVELTEQYRQIQSW